MAVRSVQFSTINIHGEPCQYHGKQIICAMLYIKGITVLRSDLIIVAHSMMIASDGTWCTMVHLVFDGTSTVLFHDL